MVHIEQMPGLENCDLSALSLWIKNLVFSNILCLNKVFISVSRLFYPLKDDKIETLDGQFEWDLFLTGSLLINVLEILIMVLLQKVWKTL